MHFAGSPWQRPISGRTTDFCGINFFNPSASTSLFAKLDVTFGDATRRRRRQGRHARLPVAET